MTQVPALKDLVVASVQDPATVARQLIALNIDRGTLWLALFLMAVLNT